MDNLEQASFVLRKLFAIHDTPKTVRELVTKGGPGSGHFGHAGRQGEVGGSEEGTGGGETPKPGGGGGGGAGRNYSSMPLGEIAQQIRKDWGGKVNFGAKPYLEAMMSLDSIDDNYFMDSGQSIVAYFLGNANSWRGDTAREIKKELNKRLKG